MPIDGAKLDDSLLFHAVIEQLREANFWLRVLAGPSIRELMRDAFQGKNDEAIYQASTGLSSRDVAKQAAVSDATVRSAWARWSTKGIVRETGVPGRYERIVDLSALGFTRSRSSDD